MAKMSKKAGLASFLSHFNASRLADLPDDVAELVKQGRYGEAADAMIAQSRLQSMADLGPQTPPPAYKPDAGPRRYYPQGTGMIVRERPRPAPLPSASSQTPSAKPARPASSPPVQDADGNAVRGLLFSDSPEGDAARFYARRAAEAALLGGGAYLLGRSGGGGESLAPTGIPEDEMHPQERIDARFMEAMRNAGRR